MISFYFQSNFLLSCCCVWHTTIKDSVQGKTPNGPLWYNHKKNRKRLSSGMRQGEKARWYGKSLPMKGTPIRKGWACSSENWSCELGVICNYRHWLKNTVYPLLNPPPPPLMSPPSPLPLFHGKKDKKHPSFFFCTDIVMRTLRSIPLVCVLWGFNFGVTCIEKVGF